MNKILLSFVVVSCVFAGALEVYSAFKPDGSGLLAFPFILAALISAIGFYVTSRAIMAKAWDEGYTKAIEDTKSAVTNVRSADFSMDSYSNPYRKKIK